MRSLGESLDETIAQCDFCSLGVGPISWFVCAEVVPQQFRSTAQGLCQFVNFATIILVNLVSLPFYGLIGAWSFLLVACLPSLFCFVYLYKALPETRGKEVTIVRLSRVHSFLYRSVQLWSN